MRHTGPRLRSSLRYAALLGCCLALASCPGVAPPEVAWWALSSGTSTFLWDICFADPDLGWAVGDAGILHTVDGGDSWATQTSPSSRTLESVDFVDATTGFIAGGNYYVDHTSRGVILKTTDGGQNWSMALQTSFALHSVCFVDATYGWAAGEDYQAANEGAGHTYIVSTTDGGQNWQTQDLAAVAGGLKDVMFVDRLTGWAVGQDGSIVATADGGATWSAQQSGTLAWLYSVHFVDAQNGWIAGSSFATSSTENVLLRTSNGGQTWTGRTLDATDLRSIHFVDALAGWTVGPSGHLYRTVNGGRAWLASSAGTSEWLNSVFFLDETHGWACGSGGTILRCTPVATP